MQTRARGVAAVISCVSLALQCGCTTKEPHAILTIVDNGVAPDAVALAVGEDLETLKMAELAGELTFPVTLTATRSTTGTFTVWAEVRDGDGNALARGAAEVVFRRKRPKTARIVLARSCTSDAECDDGLGCNGSETCDGVVCIAGAAACVTGFACITSSCNEAAGGVAECTVLADHTLCAEELMCSPGFGCIPGQPCETDGDCQDGLDCNGLEICVGMRCQRGPPPEVEDRNPCTLDGCNDERKLSGLTAVFNEPDPSADGATCSLAGGGTGICLYADGGCVATRCGDGFVDGGTGEVCDAGALGGTGEGICLATCDGWQRCGDASVDGSENCDDGDRINNGPGTCVSDCSSVQVCGDGIANGTEICDDGDALDNGDGGCLADCSGVETCGDGVIEGTEVCDEGANNQDGSWTVDGACRTDCQGLGPHCGDGVLDPINELCDDGNRNARDGCNPLCATERWFGLGGSEYGPRSEVISWGSASGDGLGALSGAPAVGFDDGDGPIVLWGAALTAARCHGGNCDQLGGMLSVDGTYPAVAADGGGGVIAAWQDSSTTETNIYVMHWTGGGWQEIGTDSASAMVSGTASASYRPAIALDSFGRPAVAWHEDTGTYQQIFVRRFDGDDWGEVGIGSASGTGISGSATVSSAFASIAFDATDNPIVAWEEGSATAEIYAKRFDGAAWQELTSGSASGGGISNAPGSRGPQLLPDPTGGMLLTWAQALSPTVSEIYVQRLVSGAWEEVGTASASGAGVSNGGAIASAPAIAIDSAGHPVVAWSQATTSGNFIFVRRFDGAAWQEMGTGSASSTGISIAPGGAEPALAVDSQGDTAVAWAQGGFVYVRHFDGIAWREMQNGTGSGNGISATAEESRTPKLVMDAAGNIVLAWLQRPNHVFVKQFDGSAWIEVGAGSASGTGIGSAASMTDKLQLILDAGTPIVMWGKPGLRGPFTYSVFDGGSWPDNGSFPGETDWVTDPTICGSSSTVRAVYTAENNLSGATDLKELGSGAGVTSLGHEGRQPIMTSNCILAWTDYGAGRPSQIYVRRLGGGEVGVGSWTGWGISATTSSSHSPIIAADPAGNPTVAWFELGPPTRMYVRRNAGNYWLDLGDPGSVSADASLAVDDSNRPILAWSDASSGRSEIYVKRFDGSEWQEICADSAQAGGISNSLAASQYPSVASANGLTCVAWSEPGGLATEIVLRCTDQ